MQQYFVITNKGVGQKWTMRAENVRIYVNNSRYVDDVWTLLTMHGAERVAKSPKQLHMSMKGYIEFLQLFENT